MIFKNFIRILKVNVFYTFATVFLLSFLVFFLNILFSLTAWVYSFSQDARNKLGIYLYFKEWDKPEDIQKTYELIIDMKTRLENNWIKVIYLSKEKAIKTLSKRLPKIIQNFEKYGIKNPIPPTMYIIFKSENQYKIVRKIVTDPKYSSIILNISDIWTENSYKKQEQIVSKTIEFTNFLVKFYVFLSVVLVLIILWFIMLILKLSFYNFYAQIEVEKLIWFSYFQIKAPFLLYSLFLILISALISYGYFYILLHYLNDYFLSVFSVNLFELIKQNIYYIKIGILSELIALPFVSLLISNIFLDRLIKKI